jgi:hypothetical protein
VLANDSREKNMTSRHARTQRFRLPPGEWARQHSVQLVTLGVLVVVFFACCKPPAWPTLIWQHVAHDCGTVQVVYARVNSPDPTRVETCFVQAYHRCTAATLYAGFFDFDYNPSYRFVIEPYGFTCALGALWNFPSRTPLFEGSGFGYCDGVQLDAKGFRVLGCQSIGDVLVPGGG